MALNRVRLRRREFPYFRDLAWIFGIALLIRVTWSLLAPQLDPFLRISPLLGDAASYDRIAQSLLNGTGYAEYPP